MEIFSPPDGAIDQYDFGAWVIIPFVVSLTDIPSPSGGSGGSGSGNLDDVERFIIGTRTTFSYMTTVYGKGIIFNSGLLDEVPPQIPYDKYHHRFNNTRYYHRKGN